MRIRDKDMEHEEPLNLMPLIDTLMFLVVFFLIATQFKSNEREVGIQLPGLASSQPLSAMPRQLVINIEQDGKAIVAGKPYGNGELDGLLKSIAKNDPSQEILIRADERSLHRYFAEVASACRRAGIGEMKIGYVAEEKQ